MVLLQRRAWPPPRGCRFLPCASKSRFLRRLDFSWLFAVLPRNEQNDLNTSNFTAEKDGEEVVSAKEELEKWFSAKADLDKASRNLRDLLKKSLQSELERGEYVLSLSRREDMPEWLVTAKVDRGRCYGSRTFLVVGEASVYMHASKPVLSEWSVEAIPLNELTGERMGSSPVIVKGCFVVDRLDEEPSESVARLASFADLGYPKNFVRRKV